MSCPSSIWCRDSNSQPLDNESPLITTRQGLPPMWCMIFKSVYEFKVSLVFAIFVNTTAYHFGRYKPSSHSNKELYDQSYSDTFESSIADIQN